MNDLTQLLSEIHNNTSKGLHCQDDIYKLLGALKACRKQRNLYVTNIIDWPTGTMRQRDNEIKTLDKEIAKILRGEREGK